MHKVKQFAGILVGIAAVLGLKFYNKAQTQEQMRKDLRAKCAAEAKCTAAVDTHFDACFEQSYSMGGRHSGGRVNTDGFLKCFNDKAGSPVFTVTAH